MNSPNDRFMQERHPEKWAARQTPHAFVPYPITADDKPDHRCTGQCACADCWANKSDPIHRVKP